MKSNIEKINYDKISVETNKLGACSHLTVRVSGDAHPDDKGDNPTYMIKIRDLDSEKSHVTSTLSITDIKKIRNVLNEFIRLAEGEK